MPLIPVTCVTAACDVCAAAYEPEEYSVHFEDLARARDTVRDCGWLITATGRVICGADDDEHHQAVAELLPAEPQPSGQLTLGEIEEGR
ncbi:hypothetical protein ACIQXD_36665 [Streptomyces uncialis]|uniref:hypothetical protein n=1 Tax=Streptomyces uncialis TaxID=1048205 RepID=UPI003810968A